MDDAKRPRWTSTAGVLARAAVLAGLGAATTSMSACAQPDDCTRQVHDQRWDTAIGSCETELWWTRNLARAVDAAKAAFYQQQPLDTLWLASLALTGSLTGPLEGDAHYLLGAALLRLNDSRAAEHLEIAARLHAAAGDDHALARDEQQLAGAWYKRGDYWRARDAEITARDAAERDTAHQIAALGRSERSGPAARAIAARASSMLCILDVARGDILRQIGDLHAAELALERAESEARTASDRVITWLKRSELHIDQGHPELARDPLLHALAEQRAGGVPRNYLLDGVMLNLAYVQRRAGEYAQALDDIEAAHRAVPDAAAYHLNRGLVLADMGQLAAADTELADAERSGLEGQWAWWAAFHRARVAARSGNQQLAIDEDRRAMAQVAGDAARAGAFGPTVIAQHRGPHLHLLGLLAAGGRWDEVIDVIAALDGQSLLDSRELPTDLPPSSRTEPRARRAPLASSTAPEAVAAWCGRTLEILVPGGDRIWRIEVADGRITGRDVGSAVALADLARRLEMNPLDPEAGRALAEAMLPAQLPGHGAPIALLVIGPLARAPLTGLRIGDAPAIERVSLVRARGFLPRASAAIASAPPLAIGDPRGDLPAAGAEARQIAERLGGTALIGRDATLAGLRRAAGAQLLHIAAHTGVRGDDAVLELADGGFAVSWIARIAPAPRVAVIASCGASAGRDDAGNGSITAAFLDAGTEIAIGTRWSVGDAEAAAFVARFYAAGGDRDPIAALALAQRDAQVSPRTRAAFEAIIARPVARSSRAPGSASPRPACASAAARSAR